jgi:hypothetical protein
MKFPTAHPQDCDNRAQVDELANATRDARGSDPQYDDIFLLRYVLSVMAPSSSPCSLAASGCEAAKHAGACG